jgi:protein-S-isoprenylcysteine O-methyltransferase Ste14
METTQKQFPVGGLARILLVTAAVGLIPLLVSRDWAWMEGWIYAGIVFLAAAISRGLVAKRNPELIADRGSMRGPQAAKTWDKVIMPVHAFMPVVSLVLAGMDRAAGSEPGYPLWVRALALIVMLPAAGFGSWAMVENRFFALTVGIQRERGHTVVSTGPYCIVRHPGYAGSLFINLATPFLLDSVWALIPMIVLGVVIIVRTALEDKMLIQDLPGYREYAQKVRFRLVPGVW